MPSNLETLASARYDVLVVGGGIHGLFAAYDAAGRGLSVALLEQGDLGSGLSSSHMATLHGGWHALERGDIRGTRRMIAERRTWARIAPHLLRPLPFLLGTYRWTRRSRVMIRAGFAAYDVLGRARNIGVSPELHLPKARLESAAATRRLFPGIAEANLGGGAVWYDYHTPHPERLTWTVALAAERAGARLANYSEVLGPLRTGTVVRGARVRDVLTGREFDLEAPVIVLAAGSHLGALMAAFGATGAPPLLRSMNLLLDRPARDIALVASAGRQALMAVPSRGHVLVGAFQPAQDVARPEAALATTDIDACLAAANSAFPALCVERKDVRLLQHGLLPAVIRRGRAEPLSVPRVIRHRGEGMPGLFSLVGASYTTARWAASCAVDAVCAVLRRSPVRCRTATETLPHAGIEDVEGRLAETLRDLGTALPRETREHLADWYGTEASDVVRHAASTHLLDRVSEDSPVLSGEIAYAVRCAHARRLSDAVLRRTPLGAAGLPGPHALSRAADIMAAPLGWTPGQRADEIALVQAMYPAAGLPATTES
jgi:glycerol-3-phosphate dehydrogenase